MLYLIKTEPKVYQSRLNLCPISKCCPVIKFAQSSNPMTRSLSGVGDAYTGSTFPDVTPSTGRLYGCMLYTSSTLKTFAAI